MFLDRLICLKYHAVNQSNKAGDTLVGPTGLSSLLSSGSHKWAEIQGTRVATAQGTVTATRDAPQLGVVPVRAGHSPGSLVEVTCGC